jgi:cell division protein FtsB
MFKFPCALVCTLLIALPAVAQQKPDSADNLKARIEKLEADNAALKKEVAALKEQLDALVKGPAKEIKPTPEEEKVKQLGKEFVEDLEKDRVASAFRSTSAAFQKRTERKAFDEMVEKSAELKGLIQVEQFRQQKVKKLSGDKGYEYYFTGQTFQTSKLVNISLVLINDSGEWKVDDVEIRVAK